MGNIFVDFYCKKDSFLDGKYQVNNKYILLYRKRKNIGFFQVKAQFLENCNSATNFTKYINFKLHDNLVQINS